MAATNTQILHGAYVGIFQRAPDKAGYDYWNNGINTGTLTLDGAVGAFSNRSEWTAIYPATMATDVYVSTLYTNLLGTAGDVAGRKFWVDNIDKGAFGTGDAARTKFLVEYIKAIIEYKSTTDTTSNATEKAAAVTAQVAVTSKVTFSETWVATTAATDPAFTGLDAQGNYVATNDQSVALLASVKDKATLDTAVTTIIGRLPAQVDVKYLQTLGLQVLDKPVEVKAGFTLLATGLDPSKVKIDLPVNNSSADTTKIYTVDSTTNELVKGRGLAGVPYFGAALLTGNKVNVGVWEQNKVLTTHQAFGSRVTLGDASPTTADNHATHVAGTIGADGSGTNDKTARGMAPGVTMQSFDYANDFSELGAAAKSGLLLSNHSYSSAEGWIGLTNITGTNTYMWNDDRSKFSVEDPDFGRYGEVALALDTVLNNNKNLLSVWAAGDDRDDLYSASVAGGKYIAFLSTPGLNSGIPVANFKPGWYLIDPTAGLTAPLIDGGNSGYDLLSQEQTAKNSLVVGAVNDNKAIASFSSYGPTDDGRLGVHIMADGVNVYSTVANNNTAYGYDNGTSMAAPNVTGSIALLHEMHTKLITDPEYTNVQKISGGTQPRFKNTATPTSATMKGLVLHTATDLGDAGPDFATGYGLLNAKAAGDFLFSLQNSYTNNRNLLAEDTYKGTEIKYGQISYFGAASGIKASLIWNDAVVTDPNLLPVRGVDDKTIDNPTKALVNDLDLYLKGPDGKFYYPWHLDPLNPSSPATRPISSTLDTAKNGDHLNNVEQVFIPKMDAPVGIYEVFVGGKLATGQTAQDFSIFFTAMPKCGQGHSWGGCTYSFV